MAPVLETWISLGLALGIGLGLGQIVPIKSLGGRVMVGATLVHLILLVVNVKLGFSLNEIFSAICALGFFGCIIFLRNVIRHGERGALLNPVFILPLLFSLAVTIGPPHQYQMFEWDEFASWAYWAKELYLTDTLLEPTMQWRNLGYPQGWPLALVFPQLPFDEFNPQRSLAIGLVWHAATLGVFYEFIVAYLRDRLGFIGTTSRIVGYTLVFAMILAEALYKLVPQNLLIEQPQILLITSVFLLLFHISIGVERTRSGVLAVGLLISSGILLKTPVLAVLPGLALALCWLSFIHSQISPLTVRGRSALINLAILVLPVLVTMGVWMEFSSGLNTGLGRIGISIDFRSNHIELLQSLASAIVSYILGWKMPLTLLSVIGLFLAFREREFRPVAFGIVIYFVLYLAGLIELYAFRFGPYEVAELQSHQRYLRVPLRFLHLAGSLIFFLVMLRYMSPAARRLKSALPVSMLTKLSAVTCIISGCAAVMQIDQDIIENASRNSMNPKRVQVIADLRADHKYLLDILNEQEKLGLDHLPTLRLIAQGDDGYSYRVARFLSLADKKGGNRRSYKLSNAYSWGPVAENVWMNKITKENLISDLIKADIIWNHRTNGWIDNVIFPLLINCADPAEWVFLVKDEDLENGFHCYPRKRKKFIEIN